MSGRHLIIAGMLALTLAMFVVAGATNNSSLGGFMLMITPFITLGAIIAVRKRGQREPLHRYVRKPYLVVCMICVACAIAGLIGTASELSTSFDNAPLAALYLGGLITAWRAAIQPSPRRAVIPVLLAHWAWIPLMVLSIKYFSNKDLVGTAAALNGIGLLGGLTMTSVLAIIGLVGFDPRSSLPEARVEDAR